MTNVQGMVGVVMPRGILFRGGAEGKIRKGIVEADLLEAVIGLPPNLFSGASIPVAICLLNKAKPAERRDKLLFVDAAQEGCFRQGKACNYLDREHIAKFWLNPVTLERSGGLSRPELRRVERIIEENQASFLGEWNVRFND